MCQREARHECPWICSHWVAASRWGSLVVEVRLPVSHWRCLPSGATVCDEAAEPSRWWTGGEIPPPDPLGACQDYHLPPVSPLSRVKPNPLENLLVHNLSFLETSRVLLTAYKAQKCRVLFFCGYGADRILGSKVKAALGKIRDGAGFSLELKASLASPGLSGPFFWVSFL